MCGIIGTTDTKNTSQFEHCLAILHHRGPNETVTYRNEAVQFGMQRLAIQDLQKNLYPFKYKNKILIFNGELYNLPELKKILQKRIEYRFKTNCDAEVLLPLITAYGFGVLKKVHGMFAIAYYDGDTNQIHLARDKFGEKPLYYGLDERKNFWFASELKAFPKESKTVSHSAIDTYLQMGFLPGTQTVFQNIFKVKPGEYIIHHIKTKKTIQAEYFSVYDPEYQKRSDLNLESVLHTIISQKMISDVPIGSFLSGGVDSSLITALMREHRSDPLHTFSISFAENEQDESQYALQVSKHLGTRHHEFTYTSRNILKNWNDVIYSLDEPICDPAVFPTYFLSQKAREHVTVILTGEGGDEFFGGYDRYQRELQLQRIRTLLPDLLLQALSNTASFKIWKASSETSDHYLPVSYLWHWLHSTEQQKKYKDTIHSIWDKQADTGIPKGSSAQLQLFDLQSYVSEQLCMKLDKMAMAHSLETRAPFLDSRLLPYLYQSGLAVSHRGTSKPLLKEVAAKYIPSEIIYRKKQGFSLPLKKWLLNDLSKITSAATTQHPIITQLYGKHAATNLIQKFRSGKNIDLTIWNYIIVNSWLKSQDK